VAGEGELKQAKQLE